MSASCFAPIHKIPILKLVLLAEVILSQYLSVGLKLIRSYWLSGHPVKALFDGPSWVCLKRGYRFGVVLLFGVRRA